MKNLPDCKVNSLLTWSLGHFGCSDFEAAFGDVSAVENLPLARAKLTDHFGFDLAGIRVDILDYLSESALEELLKYLNEKDVTFHPVLETFCFSSASQEETESFAEEYAKSLVKYDKIYRNKTITCNLHSGTRFEHEFDLEEKLETIAHNLAIVYKKCSDVGYRLVIENGGDFYCSEIVRLCQTIPGLMMVFDTGNPYLIGEDPMQAFYISAPYTAVVHFRDVKVRPEPFNQIIRMHYAPLGHGDVELEKGLEIILANCPDPLSLIFETEILINERYDLWDSLAEEIKYINSIKA